MPTENSEARSLESPIQKLRTNRKRVSHENHDEQPAKRPASDRGRVARKSLKLLPVASIEQDDASQSSEGESESGSDEAARRPITQASNLPQRYHSEHMTQSYPQVSFTPEMLRRVWFHVAVARNPNGNSYQMSLREARNATSFSIGVRRRLELLGYEIGLGVMVADLHWIPTRSCLTDNSDHDALMWQIWDWPGWKGDGEIPFLNIYLVLEEKVTEPET